MAASGPTSPTGPSPRIRRLITALLVVHFFAILTAVTSSADRDFPAPALAVWANEPLRPYLQATFLNNAYRFFAPNPGTPTVLWIRVQHEDRSVRWVEAPTPADTPLRAGYQRRLNLAMAVSQHVFPVAEQEERFEVSNLGAIYLASYARHVAHEHQAQSSVRSVGIYLLQHAPRTPQQVRDGWEAIDLRTYQAVFAGAYSAEGERIDSLKPHLHEQPAAYVVAGILKVDLYTSLAKQPDLPTPVRRLLERFPELADPEASPTNLKERIEQLLASR